MQTILVPIICQCKSFLPAVLLFETGVMRKFGRNQGISAPPRVARTISVKDMIAVLEREPQMSKSTLIYRLYDRVQSDPVAE